MLPSIRLLKAKTQFLQRPFQFSVNNYFEWKMKISALKCNLWRVYRVRNSCRRCRSVQVSKLYLANIYAVYALIRGHLGGVNQGTYAGMARDWSILFANFKSQMWGGIGMLLHFRSRIHGGRPAGFVAPTPFCRWSWKRVPFPSTEELGVLVHTFW